MQDKELKQTEQTKLRICDLRVGSKFSWGGNTYIILTEIDNRFYIANTATGYWFNCSKNHELEVTFIKDAVVCEACWDL